MRRILLPAALLLTAACAQSAVEPAASTDPFIQGVITAKSPQWGFLVEAQPAGAYAVDAAWVRTDEDTRVKQAGTGGVRWESVAEGQAVSVWIEGPVMESLPVKVVAKTLVIE